MLPIQILLVLTSCFSVETAILENVGEADLDAVRIRLEDEKAKRLLLENDVEVLMINLEELKREFSSGNKASQGSVIPRKTRRKTGITTPKTMRTTIPRFDSDEDDK